jgi:hypothetical protein
MIRRKSYYLVLSLVSTCGGAVAQEPRIEQARQFQTARTSPEDLSSAFAPTTLELSSGEDTESFGIQQILREETKLRYFRIVAEVSAFATNNVALTRTDERRDSFLLATLSLEYRRPLLRGFLLDAALRFSAFRYNRFSQLDFNSVDAGIGLGYHTLKLGGLDFALRYNFNELISAPSGDSFFTNHTITWAVQKAFEFSQAHYAYLGASAQAGFADPTEAERAEFAAFAGYHAQITRSLEADLLYRYGFYPYSEGGREDHNQTVSVALRYRFTEWASVFASGFVAWNRSNQKVFDYDAANGGVGLTLSLQF